MRRLALLPLVLLLVGCGDTTPRYPDLAFTDGVEVTPEDPVANDTVTLTFRVTNLGPRNAYASTWLVFRSGVGLIASGRLPELYRNQVSLPQVVTLVEIPGTHSYTIVLDADHEVDEGEFGGEANNERTIIITVAPVSAG